MLNCFGIAGAGVVLALALSGCGGGVPDDYAGEVDAAAAAELVERGEVLVLDIRTPEEFADGHLPGAVNIDYLAEDFAERLRKLDRDREILMHCQSGGRSALSLSKFSELGFGKIHHFAGGYRAWEEAELPVERGE